MINAPQSTDPTSPRPLPGRASNAIDWGRLRATLAAANLRITDEALRILGDGLSTVGQGYHIEKLIYRTAKTDNDLKKDLSRLSAACRTFVDVLDADMSGPYQIEAMLSDPWHGSQIPRLVEEMRHCPLESNWW